VRAPELLMILGGFLGIVGGCVGSILLAPVSPVWSLPLMVLGAVVTGLLVGGAVGARIEFGKWWWQ